MDPRSPRTRRRDRVRVDMEDSEAGTRERTARRSGRDRVIAPSRWDVLSERARKIASVFRSCGGHLELDSPHRHAPGARRSTRTH